MSDSVCAICEGTGWKVIERGGLSGAERCECQKAKVEESIRMAAGIPPAYLNANLKSFNVAASDRQELNGVLLQATAYVRDFPLPKRPGLLFTGDTGTGKTHLAVGILKALMLRGFHVRFIDCQSLLELIKKGYSESAETGEFGNPDLYWEVLREGVLLIDDLGAMRVTDWVQDTICQILTYRCNHSLPTLATTNLPDDDIGGQDVSYLSAGGVPVHKKTLREVLGDRARSRLFEMCRIIQMPGVPDYRVAMATRRGNL